ncbi:MAG TPA: hypothetical protein VG013_39260 [Gemmataceae bacterium]|jgi:hypothetical protein|nr:hypothetical protein [Gemmataceae bacterium]
MSVATEKCAESVLLRQCLDGDEAAWKLFALRHWPLLLDAVARLAGSKGADGEFVEEIADRVWCSLFVPDRSRLLAFDVGRGGLSTYLAALAWQELLLDYREEERRKRLRVRMPRRHQDQRIEMPEQRIIQEEFEARLPPRERQFFRECLLRMAAEGPPWSGTDNNARQLKHCLLRRWRAFNAC